jgi:hypothetical protein
MNLFKRLLRYQIEVLINFPIAVLNGFRIRLLRSHKKFKSNGILPKNGNIAIIAAYPGTTSFDSLSRICSWLVEFEYKLIIVINKNALAHEWYEKLSTKYEWVMLRDNIGADFGAYKAAVELLYPHRDLIDNLVLANDSMVYHPASKSLIREIVNTETNNKVSSIFLHKQGVIHASSAFLRIGPSPLGDAKFWDFWKKYYPTQSKIKMVRRGEHKLTKVLGWKNIIPAISSENLKNDFQLTPVELIQFSLWTARSSGEISRAFTDLPTTLPHEFLVEYGLENFQVSDSLGLFCARYFGAPLKMDLPKRGLTTIKQFTNLLSGFGLDPEEIKILQRILNSRESFMTKSFFVRLFS